VPLMRTIHLDEVDVTMYHIWSGKIKKECKEDSKIDKCELINEHFIILA